MNKIHLLVLSLTLLSTQLVWAQDAPGIAAGSPDNNPCALIAKACSAAGFARTEAPEKGFWHDCMKPVILGREVSGVTVDPGVAKACRANKIGELKRELKEMESVGS